MRICRRNRRNEERIAGNANNPLCCFRGVWRICFSGILVNSKGRKDMWGLLWWWNLWSYNSVTKADNFEASLGYIVKYCLKITVFMWTWYTLQRYWELEGWKCMQLPDLEINCYMFHVHKKTSGQWNSYSYNSFSIKIKTLILSASNLPIFRRSAKNVTCGMKHSIISKGESKYPFFSLSPLHTFNCSTHDNTNYSYMWAPVRR